MSNLTRRGLFVAIGAVVGGAIPPATVLLMEKEEPPVPKDEDTTIQIRTKDDKLHIRTESGEPVSLVVHGEVVVTHKGVG